MRAFVRLREMLASHKDLARRLDALEKKYDEQFKVVFEDMFPYSLSSLDLNSQETDTEYFTAEVTFKYTIYYITDMKGNRL